ALIPKEMLNEDILNSTAYQTYYAYASGAKEPKKARKFKKPALPKLKTISVSPKEPTKKPGKAKKDVPLTKKPATKPKPTKKKAPVKADRGKGDGTNFEAGFPDEQQCKISSTDEGTGTKPGVPDIPKYDSKSKKETWGDSGEEDDDDEDDTEDESDNDGNDDDDDNDGNDDDDNHGNDDDDNDGNDDDGDNDDNDDDSNHERTESDIDKNPNLNQSSTKYEEEEEKESERVFTPPEFVPTNDEEKIDDEVKMDEEEDDDVTKLLYKDVNVNLGSKDADMTDVDQGGADQHNKTEGPMQSSSVSSDFTKKLLNFKNVSPADNEIASLIDTNIRHEEPSGQTSSLYTKPIMYAQSISSIPAIIDRYIDNKHREAIQQAIKSHTTECRKEAIADKREYIDLIDTSVRAIIKEEVRTQLP
ncbi:hypothetical protein Tco_1116474, partial [Tanacetum coccineum]